MSARLVRAEASISRDGWHPSYAAYHRAGQEASGAGTDKCRQTRSKTDRYGHEYFWRMDYCFACCCAYGMCIAARNCIAV